MIDNNSLFQTEKGRFKNSIYLNFKNILIKRVIFPPATESLRPTIPFALKGNYALNFCMLNFAFMRYFFSAFLGLMILLFGSFLKGQTTFSKAAYNYTKIYHPEENVDSAFQSLTQIATKSHRRIWITVGGNWCIWCARFDLFLQKNKSIQEYADSNFVLYHLDYSTKNLTQTSVKNLHLPDTIDFPSFVILDPNGTVLTIQSASPFLQTYTYDTSKVRKFLKAWSMESQ